MKIQEFVEILEENNHPGNIWQLGTEGEIRLAGDFPHDPLSYLAWSLTGQGQSLGVIGIMQSADILDLKSTDALRIVGTIDNRKKSNVFFSPGLQEELIKILDI